MFANQPRPIIFFRLAKLPETLDIAFSDASKLGTATSKMTTFERAKFSHKLTACEACYLLYKYPMIFFPLRVHSCTLLFTEAYISRFHTPIIFYHSIVLIKNRKFQG